MNKQLACQIYYKAKSLQSTYRFRNETTLHCIEIVISRMRLKHQIEFDLSKILPEQEILRVVEGVNGFIPSLFVSSIDEKEE